MFDVTAYQEVDRYLTAHREGHLAELRSFLTIPSISTLSQHAGDMRAAAAVLVDRLCTIGLTDARLFPTSGNPVVIGSWRHAPGRPTVLVYGHYDVQPVDPLDQWLSPPFEPTERDGKLYARGATDDKGQVWMHLMVIEALLATTGRLPINLVLVLEGEEEVGSHGLMELVPQQTTLLSADLTVISDSSLYARGVPSLCYGLRGNTSLELHVRGPRNDLHSGLFGGSVVNPLHTMAQLIAGLHHLDGRVAVPGFYDEVVPLSDRERAAFAALPHDDARYCDELGVPETFGEPGYSTLERTWARPTLEVNGMWGGFQGEGSKTIVPSEGFAKITCRLVPNQEPCTIQARVAEALRRACPPGARLEIDTRGCGSVPIVTPIDTPAMQAAARSMARAYGQAPGYIRMGGSIPIASVLIETLHAPLVLMGFGLPDEQLHAPNEHLNLENYDRGQRALAAYWLELAGVAPEAL